MLFMLSDMSFVYIKNRQSEGRALSQSRLDGGRYLSIKHHKLHSSCKKCINRCDCPAVDDQTTELPGLFSYLFFFFNRSL